MFCPKCGTELKDGARFCPACGAAMDSSNEKSDQKEPVAPASPKPAVPEPAKPTAPAPPQPAKTSAKRALPSWLPLAALGAAAVLAIVLAVSFIPRNSSGGGSSPTALPKGEPGTWTVMTYLCGSNLESEAGCASENIEEILSLTLPQNVNFVLQTGGSRSWQNSQVDPDHLQRFAIRNNELVLEDEQPQASMADSATLSDFVLWSAQTHPAEHYVLVFWDHGGGSLTGVCQDELYDDGLTLPEMNEALQTAGVHFDVVGFDTCLMGTLETAQMLSNHADYLVASEEVEPQGGWSWAEWPAWFSTTQSNDPAELGTHIVDTYMDKCDADGVGTTATLSVVDLSRMGEVESAFDKASQGMARATERAGNLQRLVVNGRGVESFGYADYLNGYTDMVDLNDLLTCVEDSLPDAAADVHKAVSNAVCYERHGELRPNAAGLSVFYPLNINAETFEEYLSLSQDLALNNTPYLQYLAVRTGVYSTIDWKGQGISDLDPVEEADAKGAFTCTPSISSDGHLTVKITGNTEFVSVATYSLGLLLDDGTVALLGSNNNLGLEIDSKGQVTYTEQFLGGVLNIGGCYVRADIVEMVAKDDAPAYNLYSVPVELTTTNSLGKEVTIPTNLLVAYDYKTNTHDIVCVYESTDETGMAPKSVQRLRIGDKLKFIAARIVDEKGTIQTGTTGTITVDENLKVEELNPGDNNYVYTVTVTDIFGNDYPGGTALISYKDGKRTAQLQQ